MSLKRETPLDIQLHRAAIKGDQDTIIRVLGTGRVHVDCRDSDGTTPLMFAVARCHYNCVIELLEQGADTNIRRYETGASPLFLAAQNGDCDTVRVLLKNGALVDRPNIDGGTSLVVASQEGHEACVRILLQAGASPNYPMTDKSTSIFLAAQNGHYGVVKMLLEHGALVDPKRSDGATPLWIAAQMGWSQICSCLLDHGADVDSLRYDGQSALFKASHKGFGDVVRVLLRKKPNLGLLPNGESCLHGAVMYGQEDIVRLLMKAGSNPVLVNHHGETPYDVAVKHKFERLANYFKKFQDQVL